MPTVTIEMYEGRTIDQKRAVAKSVTTAIVESLNVPPEAVSIKFVHSKKEDHARAGVLVSDKQV